MAQKTKKIIFLEAIAYAALLIAALIYAFCRVPNTYFAFAIEKTLQINLQDYQIYSSDKIFNCLVFSLPSGLWVMASTIFAILMKSEDQIWSFVPIFLVIGIEVLQFLGITDGTFDWNDLHLAFLGFVGAKSFRRYNIPSKEYYRWNYWICIVALPFSDVM